MSDLISRAAAFDSVEIFLKQTDAPEVYPGLIPALERVINNVPSAQPEIEERTEEFAQNVPKEDLISRKAAIDAADRADYTGLAVEDVKKVTDEVVKELKQLPSAQPERRCVNCGRTVNNGGWYEDGRTRCPIEEHYALPKDGYCHLWEKRKDWEDDYVKRAEEGEK